MRFASGSRLGPYEIVSLLGSGGMGEVYEARDTRLGRGVAIKVLLDGLVADQDSLVRFEREARALAALNHPNIAALHGVDETEGRHLLVMELVAGETLADRLRRGALPPRDAMGLALQIAEALEAAHEQGIVHRDLKPANVKITADGKVKVLDFGLATAVRASEAGAVLGAHAPTIVGATQEGALLGTAAYMSPEQARGLRADHRSDVFAFGIVLYEMLTGRAPFEGDTLGDLLASILTRDPDLTALPAGLHPRLVDLLRRCLDKAPRRRWQAMGDVRLELEALAQDPLQAPTVRPVLAERRAMWPWLAVAAAGAVLTVGLLWGTAANRRPAAVLEVTRLVIVPDEPDPDWALGGWAQTSIAVSPDGRRVVFAGSRQLYLRDLSAFASTAIAGTLEPARVSSPVFSPDGRSVAYYSQATGELRRLPTTGGTPMAICKVATPRGLSWQGDHLLYSTGPAIMRVAASGGTPERLVELARGEFAYGPRWLPGGRDLLFSLRVGVADDRWEEGQVVVQSLVSGQRTVVVPTGASGAQYVSSGHILYATEGVVFAVPFDPARRTALGRAVPVIPGVSRSVGFSYGALDVAVSDTGTLVYISGPASPDENRVHLGLFDRAGGSQNLAAEPGRFVRPRLSPDGLRVAYSTGGVRATEQVGVIEASGASAPRQLTFDGSNRHPVWSADSRRVAFTSTRDGDAGIFWQATDGTGTAERLTRAEAGVEHVPQSMSSDGAHLLYDVVTRTGVSLSVLSMRDRTSSGFGGISSLFSTGAVFSPDGRWVAYTLHDSMTAVYVQPFPGTGARSRYLVSEGAEAGHHPVWSADGRELYFTPGAGPRLHRVTVMPSRSSFQFIRAVPVVRRFQNLPPPSERPYDVTRDGRFLSVLDDREVLTGAARSPIYVVLHWFEELRAAAPTR